MQHYESVCACVTEILLGTQDTRAAVIIFSKLHKAIEGTGTAANRHLNPFGKCPHSRRLVRAPSP